jgi:hypothetical protein
MLEKALQFRHVGNPRRSLHQPRRDVAEASLQNTNKRLPPRVDFGPLPTFLPARLPTFFTAFLTTFLTELFCKCHGECGERFGVLLRDLRFKRLLGAKSPQRNLGQCGQRVAERGCDELWKVAQVGWAVLALFFQPTQNDFSGSCPPRCRIGGTFSASTR